jgi:hypothetical protein
MAGGIFRSQRMFVCVSVGACGAGRGPLFLMDSNNGTPTDVGGLMSMSTLLIFRPHQREPRVVDLAALLFDAH